MVFWRVSTEGTMLGSKVSIWLCRKEVRNDEFHSKHTKSTWGAIMKTISAIGVLLLALFLASFSTLLSAEETSDSAATKNATSAGGFTYRPPVRGAPASRVGGGSRGTGGITGELSVLAPDHTGLTTRSQPTLYWYLSKPANARLDVTVINDEKIDPLLEQVIGIPKSAGIQSLDLATVGTKLKPGVEYRWFVSLTPDEAQRSNDIVASGTIEYVMPDAGLESQTAKADELTLARIYAEDGIWYDAIDSVSRAIQQNPGDASLHAQRAAMLEQVGLKSAADYDRK
jgi:Domain of Unknown Function (DUF928)